MHVPLVTFCSLLCAVSLYMHAVLYRVLSAVINGATYRKEIVVVCGFENDTPMFGSIAEIIVTPHQECFFVLSPLITIAFRYHYHAFEVVPTDTIVVYNYKQLFDFHPLVYTVGIDHSIFVSMKYHLFS